MSYWSKCWNCLSCWTSKDIRFACPTCDSQNIEIHEED